MPKMLFHATTFIRQTTTKFVNVFNNWNAYYNDEFAALLNYHLKV